jgi:hypothetical protein
MAVEEIQIQKRMRTFYTASHDVIQAVRTLILQAEAIEEEVLRAKLPEGKMSEDELSVLDNAQKEMREIGKSISLEEFTKKHRPTLRGED